MEAHELHVLMVSLPYQGHINPMLRLANLLITSGIHVTMATTEVARHRLSSRNITSTTGNPNPPENPNQELLEFEFFADGLNADEDRDKNLGVLLEEYLPTKGAGNLSDLISDFGKKGRGFSCMIVNCFVPWAVDVAAAHGIPCAMLWVQACALYAIYYRYHKGMGEFPSLDDASNSVELPGLPLLKVQDLPTFLLPSGPPHFKNVVAACIHSLDKIRWVLGSSFHKLEEDVVKSMSHLKPIHPIGPLVPPILLGKLDRISGAGDFWDSEDSCIEWLSTQRPSSVLYISLGSISVLSESETKAVAAALETTKAAFLWVVKKREDGWGRRSGELPEGFLERTKDRGRVVRWCPQDRVLMSGAVGCFLTHCGWNSTLETVAAGVPVIAFPDWTDQPTNAKLLVDVFGMGVRMRRGMDGRLSEEEVERCIFEVTEGPMAMAMKKKAVEWKEAAMKASACGGSSDLVTANFIGEISAINKI
ncbi:hypothetical protein Nepgr_027055 [Nepenthes gracilis]|uniref:Glycosyltransferase n=1 Tax=Nepenthes gracilis TaxID=150966 RepID=A0AAD3Y0Y0_NEPGR|nr:hypothetical protein Nepgr_027055 [Nepenthes gracilis]